MGRDREAEHVTKQTEDVLFIFMAGFVCGALFLAIVNRMFSAT
jgi:hypothetical protein